MKYDLFIVYQFPLPNGQYGIAQDLVEGLEEPLTKLLLIRLLDECEAKIGIRPSITFFHKLDSV